LVWYCVNGFSSIKSLRGDVVLCLQGDNNSRVSDALSLSIVSTVELEPESKMSFTQLPFSLHCLSGDCSAMGLRSGFLMDSINDQKEPNLPAGIDQRTLAR
jgi:hypothetical protein